MQTIAIYADTLSQWSVVRPFLAKAASRFCVHLLLGASVVAEAQRLFPDIPRKPLDELAPTLGKPRFYFSRMRTKDMNYGRYRAYRSNFDARIASYKRWLASIKADAVVLGEDGISGELWLICAAKSLGIPTLVMPYEASGKEDFISLLREKKRENSLLVQDERNCRFLETIGCLDWVTDFEGVKASIYDIEYIAALRDSGITFVNPWTTHGGSADILLSESPGMSAHYKDEGVPESKIKLTGSPYDDVMAARFAENDALLRAHAAGSRVEEGRTKILVSLPPNYHSSRSGLSPFESYTAMCEALEQSLGGGADTQVSVVVHPAYHSQAPLLENSTGVSLSREWVMDLIPRHDVFITCGSSTLRWASAARKATINFDLYKFRLLFFHRLPGLMNFEEADACFSFVRDLKKDDAFNRHIAGHKAQTTEWAYLDGQCGTRIVDAIAGVS